MKINQRIAIVTGASSGLGEAISMALIGQGASVYGLARNKNKLEALQRKLGSSFYPVEMDITQQSAVKSWVDRTFSEDHIPDILVNNAGAGYFNKIDELPMDQWHQMINTNLNGTFYLTSAIVPFMKKENHKAHIINIGSIIGKTSMAEGSAYAATKHAMQGFSESLMKELRSFNIKVTVVNPGSISTHFFDDSGIKPSANILKTNEVADLIVKLIDTPDNLLVDEITLRPLNP